MSGTSDKHLNPCRKNRCSADADPLFAWLAAEKPFKGFGKGLKNTALNKYAAMNNKKFGEKTYIGWNFTKFLIDREGKVIARFEPTEDT